MTREEWDALTDDEKWDAYRFATDDDYLDEVMARIKGEPIKTRTIKVRIGKPTIAQPIVRIDDDEICS